MKKITPDARLEQLLERLSIDLAQATDAELLEACAVLGIKPGMKGTIAFLGVKGIFFAPYSPEKLAPLADPSVGPNHHDSDSPNLPRRH